MENFYSLRAEKQEHIINAALTVFGKNGYKKTSTADIAETSGIAKGMIFYYFGSKKALYLYLIDFCWRKLIGEVGNKITGDVSDVFDRVRLAAEIKTSLMRQYPAIMSFMTSFYYETDPGVRGEIKTFLAENENLGTRLALEGADMSRFKDDVDPELIMKFLIWASEGFANGLPKGASISDFESYMGDFYKCLDIMKKYFYK